MLYNTASSEYAYLSANTPFPPPLPIPVHITTRRRLDTYRWVWLLNGTRKTSVDCETVRLFDIAPKSSNDCLNN